MPENGQIDNELMLRLQRDDLGAMNELMDRWQKPLLSFINRYTNEFQSSQDIAQETFVRVYRARERFDAQKRFSGWLFQIAANLSRNHLRWKNRHKESVLNEECLSRENLSFRAQSERSLASKEAGEENLQILRKVIAGMPHKLKTALLLHYYEELSYLEISQVIGCSERGVESRLYRGRKWLSKRFAEERERG